VTFVNNMNEVDVASQGRAIRNSPEFQKEGINVNFVEVIRQNEIKIRTYERGVEDETMACGTGVVAAALVHAFDTNDYAGECIVHALGGDLKVKFERKGEQQFENIFLIGPVEEVFHGEVLLNE
jgi:diaminopimelate epimerase